MRYGTKVRGYLLSTSPVSPIYTHTICTSYWYSTSYNTGYRHNTVTWHVILYPGNTFLNCSFHCLTTPCVVMTTLKMKEVNDEHMAWCYSAIHLAGFAQLQAPTLSHYKSTYLWFQYSCTNYLDYICIISVLYVCTVTDIGTIFNLTNGIWGEPRMLSLVVL